MAAEHWGNCQICGREHKVTGRSIAKHGYTIRNGWQQGACYGSGGKPIQISCDLIEGAIRVAQTYVERTTKEIADMAEQPLDRNGRISTFFTKLTRTGQQTELVDVTVTATDKGDIVLTDTTGKVRKTYQRVRDGMGTVEAVVRHLADRRIAYLRQTITDSEESIAWLTKRVQDWKPSDLREISPQEKAAVGPKVHFRASKYGYKYTTACAASAMGAQRMNGSNTTEIRAEVTCAACLKTLAEQDGAADRKAAAAAKERATDIKDAEKQIKEIAGWIKKGDDDPAVILRWSETLIRYAERLVVLKQPQQ